MKVNQKMISPELQLVLSCCSNQINNFFNSNKLLVTNGVIDHDEILRLCHRHQISPIIFHATKNINNPLSIKLNEALQDIVLQIQMKGLATKAFLQKLERKIIEHRIPVFLLKGISLSRRYYGDLGMRDAMDVDLLITENHLDHVIELLSEMGFSPAGEFVTYTPRQKAFVKYIDYHFGFSKIDRGEPRYLELHWALRNRYGNFILNPFLSYQSELTNITSSLKGLLELNDIDCFLFLCSHASEHAFYRLKWLVDIYMVHTKVEFDHYLLVNRSIELKCTEQLILSYIMLESFFSVPMPTAIEDSSNKFQISNWLKNYCINQVLYPGNYCDTFSEKIKNLRFSFIMNRKGMLNKRLLMRYFTSPNDWKIFKLPDTLFFLYFPLRPFLFVYRRLIESNVYDNS